MHAFMKPKTCGIEPFFWKTIIMISLFQEDNIFGTNASLTYDPRLQR